MITKREQKRRQLIRDTVRATLEELAGEAPTFVTLEILNPPGGPVDLLSIPMLTTEITQTGRYRVDLGRTGYRLALLEPEPAVDDTRDFIENRGRYQLEESGRAIKIEDEEDGA